MDPATYEGWEAAIDWEPPRRPRVKPPLDEQWPTLELWRSAFALTRIAATATCLKLFRAAFTSEQKPR